MTDRRPFDRNTGSRKSHDRLAKTICQECGVNCGLVTYLANDDIVDIHGDEAHPVNRGKLCARGIAFVQGLNSDHRITAPGIRRQLSDAFTHDINWEGALDTLAETLRKISDQHGPQAIAVAAGPGAGLDFTIGAIRFARLLKTPRLLHTLDLTPGIKRPDSVIPTHQWDRAGWFLFVDADMATSHPVAFGRAMQAQRHGKPIITADTRFTRSMAKADLALRILPDSGNLLGLALMKFLVEENIRALDISSFPNPFEWKASFSHLSWAEIRTVLGIGTEKIEKISRCLLENGPGIIITGSNLASISHYGIWPTLIAAMNGAGTAGSWYPLDAGTPALDPCMGLDDAPEPPDGGELPIKAVLCAGDCLANMFTPLKVAAADLTVIASHSAFPNTTGRLAHMVFPSTLWPEKNSLCFSNDRSVQWAPRIRDPRPDQRSGIEFWHGLAQRFGWADAFPWTAQDGGFDDQAFYQWVLDSTPATKGCRLEQIAIGTPSSLYTWSEKEANSMADTIDPVLAPASLKSPFQDPDRDRYPLYFQQIPMVAAGGEGGPWWPWTRGLEPQDAVQIHPETARILDIDNGDAVLITSPAATVEGQAWINRMVPQWMVAAHQYLDGNWVLIQKEDQIAAENINRLKGLLP